MRKILLFAQGCLIGLLALAMPQNAQAFDGSTHRGLCEYSWDYTPYSDDYQEWVSDTFDIDFRDKVGDWSVSADSNYWRAWQTENLLGGNLDVGFHGFLNENYYYPGEGFLLSSGFGCPASYTMAYTSGYIGNKYQGDTRLVAALQLLEWAIYYKSSWPEGAARYLGFGLHLIQDYFAHLDAYRLSEGDDHQTGIAGDYVVDKSPFSGYDAYDVHSDSGGFASWYQDSSWVHNHGSSWTSAWRFKAAEAMGERYIKSFIYESPWCYLDANGIWGNYNGAWSEMFGWVPTNYLDRYMWYYIWRYYI